MRRRAREKRKGRGGRGEEWVYKNTVSDLRKVKSVRRIKNKNKKYKGV